MTEVTPPLENTRFSLIFEYNRFMTPLLFLGGSFCVKSNRGIRRLLLDIAVVSNEDSDDRLGGIVIVVYCNEVSLIADTVVNYIGLSNSDIFVSVNVPLDEEKCDKVLSKNLFSCHS